MRIVIVTLEAMLDEIRALSVRERKQLISLIIDTLPEETEADAARERSITELRGLGKEIWEGIDAQAYIDDLRDEWDQRS